MRIAIISSLFPPFAIGGAEEAAASLALALRDIGQQVHIVSTRAARDVGEDGFRLDRWNGLDVWRIAPRNVYWSFERQTKRPGAAARAIWHAVDLWNPSIVRPLRRVLRGINPDVINTHNIDGLSPEVWRVARSVTGAIAHTLHDCHLICPRATMVKRNGDRCEGLCSPCKAYARFNLLFQRYVRALIAPSSAIAHLHQQQGWRGPLVRVVRNAVDIRPTDLERTPEGPLHVLFLSRLEREKGCETLLRAIKGFDGSPELRFHVAGRGHYEEQFIALAREIPNLEWHGFVSGAAKSDLLSRTDVFLQLSECAENAPLGLMEAARFGLFAIGSECGGIPELIDSPETGYLIPPGDAARLSASLEDLVFRKAELRSRRPERARKALGYGTREMAEEYMRVFDQLLSSEGGRNSEMTNPATSHG